MDKSALTEQRRETVIGLLKGMNIKKSADGGFDKDSVYQCMQDLCDLYEQNIEVLENAYESELDELKEKYKKYDDNNDLYVSLIMEAKKSSNEIINQAKSEVESILSEGKEQVAKQEEELRMMREGMETEQRAIADELKAAREAVEAEKAAMRAEVEAEKEKVAALKNKYTQQINAMEEEFMEIKTNILRTAGRLDSLKSKLPEDEEAQWNLRNDVDTVDFPASEIEVESIVDAPVTPSAEIRQEPFVAPDLEPEIDLPPVQPADPAPMADAQELTLEDLTGPAGQAPEINFDNIQVDLPDLEEPAAPSEEEISFEGLEELFKEDEKEQ